MINAVGYVRVSTGEQYATPEIQKKEIIELCNRKGWKLIDIYSDIGVSGSIYPLKRPGFVRCVETLRKVGGGIIVAYALDRIARMNTYDFKKLIEELSNLNIRLYFVREESVIHIVLTNPLIGSKIVDDYAFYSKLEREYISDRVRLAFQNPNIRKKFEEEFEKKTGLKITKNLPKEIKDKVIELRKQGLTIREIAKNVGITTYKVLKILTEVGLTNLKPDTCPRCFSKLTTENILGYVKVYYCKNCGYKHIEKLGF